MINSYILNAIIIFVKEAESEVTQPAIDIGKIKALGNMDRVKILHILSKGSISWTELLNELQVNPNTLNFHLTKLLHSELITREVVENENGRPATKYQISREGKKYYEANKRMAG